MALIERVTPPAGFHRPGEDFKPQEGERVERLLRVLASAERLRDSAFDNNVNFVWSFDSFVHMEPEHIASYMREMARVLVPGGRACIHHAGRANAWLWLGGVRSHAKWLRRLYALLSMGVIKDDDGWRSNMSGELFRRLAEDAGLKVVAQQRFWGPGLARQPAVGGLDWAAVQHRPAAVDDRTRATRMRRHRPTRSAPTGGPDGARAGGRARG